MRRFFMDASVLFSAAYSSRGHARDLLLLAAAEAPRVRLVVSPDVLDETRRNLAYSVPEKLPIMERLFAVVPFELVSPARRQVAGAARRFPISDAPILAAARKARANALVTFDEKHLLNDPAVARYVRAPVLRPREARLLLEAEET